MWLPPNPAARRAVAGAARAGEPALPARARARSLARTFLWKNFFIGVDDGLKSWERFSARGPLRERAVEAARRVAGGAARGAGRPRRHLPRHGERRPRAARARLSRRPPADPRARSRRSRRSGSRRADELHYQPCVVAGVGHRAGRQRARSRRGLPADHPALQRAAEWMIDKQITVPGDWQVKRPHVPPGRLGRSSTTTTSIRISTTPPWC